MFICYNSYLFCAGPVTVANGLPRLLFGGNNVHWADSVSYYHVSNIVLAKDVRVEDPQSRGVNYTCRSMSLYNVA